VAEILKIEIYAHACCKISLGEDSIVIDPWLVGRTYWDGWQLDPLASEAPENVMASALIISHWHFDHLNIPTLRRMNKNIPVFVPRFPISWMKSTIDRIGFLAVKEIPHGEKISIGALRATLYQSQFNDDCVIVVDTPFGSIINLNDAKPLPKLVKKINQKHFPVIATMRSYSPAWSYPSRFDSIGTVNKFRVKPNTYQTMFFRDSEKFNPRHLIAFASGVSHPHPELRDEGTHRITFEDLKEFASENGLSMPLLNGQSGSIFEFSEDSVSSGLSGRTNLPVFEQPISINEVKHWSFEIVDARLKQFRKWSCLFHLFTFGWFRFRIQIVTTDKSGVFTFDSLKGRIDDSSSHIDVTYTIASDVLVSALSQSIFTNIDISKRWRVDVHTNFNHHLFFTALYGLFEHGYLGKQVLKIRVIREWWLRRSDLWDYFKIVTGRSKTEYFDF